MPRVAVSLDAFDEGAFPSVCVRTGQVATTDMHIQMTYTPRWVLVMLLFGILPYFVAAYFATRRRAGILPVSDEFVLQMRRSWTVMWGAFALAVALFVLAYATESPAAAWAAGAASLVWAAAVVYRSSTAVRGDLLDDMIVLRNAHPRFVAAVDGATGR